MTDNEYVEHYFVLIRLNVVKHDNLFKNIQDPKTITYVFALLMFSVCLSFAYVYVLRRFEYVYVLRMFKFCVCLRFAVTRYTSAPRTRPDLYFNKNDQL